MSRIEGFNFSMKLPVKSAETLLSLINGVFPINSNTIIIGFYFFFHMKIQFVLMFPKYYTLLAFAVFYTYLILNCQFDTSKTLPNLTKKFNYFLIFSKSNKKANSFC